MNKIPITIIMAAYNASDTVGESIKSVINQTYKNWEMIIIDDCSTDNTREVICEAIAEDARIRMYKNKKNCGVTYSRKRALNKADGVFIAIIDSDDIWREDKLEKQICLYKKTKAKLVYTGSKFVFKDNKMSGYYMSVPDKVTYKQLLKKNVISNSSVFIATDLYKKYYVTEEKVHEDYAEWLLYLKDGNKAVGIDEPLLIYRIDKESRSGRKAKAALMRWNSYRYTGLNFFSAAYYMIYYTVSGLKKYKDIYK